MKLHKLFFTLLLILLTDQIYFGQENPQAQLIDEFGKACNEEFLAKSDAFLVGLNNDPTATGFIIFYGDKLYEGRNLNYIRAFDSYISIRKFDKTRILILRGENQGEMKTQFWIVPAGASPPKPETEFIESKIIKTTLFDKNWADFNRDFGKLDIYSDGFDDLGCEFSPNRKGFAGKINSNPELTGYLVIYTKFGRGKAHADKIASFALRELIREFKISRNRLKIIYGGNRKEPEIEFWLAPKGSNPPTPTPQKRGEK
jgi:hypothetical protein